MYHSIVEIVIGWADVCVYLGFEMISLTVIGKIIACLSIFLQGFPFRTVHIGYFGIKQELTYGTAHLVILYIINKQSVYIIFIITTYNRSLLNALCLAIWKCHTMLTYTIMISVHLPHDKALGFTFVVIITCFSTITQWCDAISPRQVTGDQSDCCILGGHQWQYEKGRNVTVSHWETTKALQYPCLN